MVEKNRRKVTSAGETTLGCNVLGRSKAYLAFSGRTSLLVIYFGHKNRTLHVEQMFIQKRKDAPRLKTKAV